MSDFMEKELKNSFRKLLKIKPLNKITVNDIVKDTGVNRNSFYYHFKDIPDILEKIIISDSNEFILRYASIDSIDELILAAYTFALEKREIILNIYSAMEGTMYEKSALELCEKLVSIYMSTSGIEFKPKDKEIIEKYLSFTLFGCTVSWIIKGMPEEELDSLKRVGVLMKKGIEDIVTEIATKRK